MYVCGLHKVYVCDVCMYGLCVVSVVCMYVCGICVYVCV